MDKYLVLSGVTARDLVEDVNRHILIGWKPLGGLTKDIGRFYQVIVRD